ncbi:two-component system, NtrC family, nitrogen regulation sensor histidine kinase NtrY [Malonomonas rubra DSM 5091]|uniref:histidine kinase n=1 Tax=Malonomonas rubra DSM 5091 TaxID=1122189 RepID=A0A1M6M440_MALRU|nr:ATP-binding protein [Malonomonas rubra]SHJ78166.1 two-component system, NtrC family, nitrogen regulation sensor histidine kinase NtrY [Malonomonas rubra DSM 5091]
MNQANDKITKLKKPRRRAREWVLLILIVLVLVLIPQLETELIDLSSQLPISNNIIALGLINLNILLVLLFLFLIFRNLFKLMLERRRGVPGAKLRSKLVGAFIALSLVPTMLLFFVSAGFISNSIDNWFNAQVENALDESLNVAQTFYRNSEANALYYADQLAQQIKQGKLLNEENLPQLRQLIKLKQQEYNLGIVEVFSATHEELVRVANPKLPIIKITSATSDPVREGLQGVRFSQISPVGQADLIRGIVPVQSNWNPKDIVGVVVVNYYVPYSLINKIKEIASSVDQYKTTKQIKGEIQQGYVIILLLIALIIIFLATWFGFHLARGITVPIQELAEATSRVASGDLDIQLETRSTDEIGTLVKAFNTMTTDLRQGRIEVEAANLELQNSNTELEQRRNYMEIVLANVTAGVVSVDRYGRLTTVNKSAENLLHFKAEKIVGEDFRKVIPSPYMPQIMELLKELFYSEKGTIRQQLTIPIGNEKYTLLINLTTLRDDQGNFMGTVAVFDDLTQLFKAQRMAAWREVARRIAHEIKNPLTPIQLSAQRLRRRYLSRFESEDNVFDDCTQMISRQVDELKNLVNEFSNFARMPATKPTPNNLNEIVNECLILYQEGHKNIAFSKSLDKNLPTSNLDREQIKRVIINLLENAVAALDDKGKIGIESIYNPELQIITLTISDNGTGIRDEDKPRLFEPYFSTKKTGTGLGLAIVSTIISDHNGYIRVRDNSPKGSRFIIELPANIS